MASMAKDIIVTIATRVVGFMLTFSTSIILARLLGPALVGSYRILILIFGITTLFALFGLGAANVYYGAKDRTVLAALTGNSIAAGIGLGTMGALLLTLLSTSGDFQAYLADNGLSLNTLRLLVWVLPLSLTTSYLQEIIRADGDITRYNLVFILKSGVMLVGVLIGVLLLGYGLTGAIYAWLLAEVAPAIWTLTVVLSITKYRIKVDTTLLRQCFKFGIHLYPGNIMQFLNYRLDVFLVGYYLPPAHVGYYTTAGGLAEKLWEFPTAIRTSLLHRVSSGGSAVGNWLRTAQIIRLLSVFMGALCILMALFSYWIIVTLYGVEYLPAAPAIVALMPGIWALSIGKIVAIHMAGVGKPRVGTYGAAVSLVFTILFDLLLIPRLGILGAALTSSIAYTTSTLLMTVIFLRASSLPPQSILIPTHDDFRLITHLTRRMIQQVRTMTSASNLRRGEVQ